MNMFTKFSNQCWMETIQEAYCWSWYECSHRLLCTPEDCLSLKVASSFRFSDLSTTGRVSADLTNWSRKRSLTAHVGMHSQSGATLSEMLSPNTSAGWTMGGTHAWQPAEEGFVLFHCSWSALRWSRLSVDGASDKPPDRTCTGPDLPLPPRWSLVLEHTWEGGGQLTHLQPGLPVGAGETGWRSAGSKNKWYANVPHLQGI